MLFPTPEFAIFLTIVLILAQVLAARPTARKVMLTVASYVFYGWWSWKFAGLLAASSTLTWAAGQVVWAQRRPTRRRWIVVGAVSCDLAVLAWFKYADFGIAQIDAALRAAGCDAVIPFVGLAVPVGVSFFTFHAISYVVDLHVGRLAKPSPLIDVLLYEAFFPQLVAGPIVRASHFMPQLAAPAGRVPIPFARAGALIASGLFKKVVIATTLASACVDPAFRDPTAFQPVELAFAALAYSVQIYCDFSAYTDIAIGLAALLGYSFPRNFDAPYAALGFSDFWRRWHISLSSWLRDYLYIPLGGSRAGTGRMMVALLATMLIGGLWHGAAWTFVVWGGIHGLALIVERLIKAACPTASPGRWGRGALRFATFTIVTLAWIPFRAADFETALAFFQGLARAPTAPAHIPLLPALLAAAVLAVQQTPRDWALRLSERLIPLSRPLLAGAAIGVACAAAMALGPDGVPPFIYFQF